MIPPDSNSAVSSTPLSATAAPLHLKNILVPIDFSDTSEKALAYAIPLARAFGAKITLLHVVEIYVFAGELGYAVPFDEVSLIETASKRLRAVGESMLPPGVLCDARIRRGTAFQEITAAAAQMEMDLIVLTTHGHTGLAHILLGSTAERVIRHAKCPVFVVRASDKK